jgi:hypothetical protein
MTPFHMAASSRMNNAPVRIAIVALGLAAPEEDETPWTLEVACNGRLVD